MGAAGSGGPSDDEFNRVSFLSHFEGSNNGVNNAFDDGSTSNHTITANGNVTQGSFNPFGTNWSHEFLPDTGNAAIVGGTGDRDDVNNDATRISVPASASNFAWGNPFTIEFFCFLRKLSTSNAGGFSYDLDNNFMLNQANSNALVDNGGPPDSAFSIIERAGNLVINVRYDPAGDGSQASATNAASHASNTTSTGDDFAVNTWHHVAMTWDGSNYYGYVDGVRKATINSSTAPHRSDEPIRIGGLRAGNSNEYGNMDGFISNVRIVIGTNLYPNNNFTPPTSQLTAVTNTKLLTCHSNRMLDGSSIGGTVTADPQDTGMNGAALQGKVSNFGPFLSSAVYDPAVNGASAYLDGTGDYLTAGDSTDYEFGTGDFTIEAWVYASSVDNPAIVSKFPNGARQFSLELSRDNNNHARYRALIYIGESGVFSNEYIAFNAWNHIAIVGTASDTTARIYTNGIRNSNTISYSGGVPAGGADPLRVGSRNSGGYFYYEGYICDLRLLKGTAAYSGASFTPPTAPLTAITNTKLLLNMADGQAIDSAAQNNLTLYGNANTSTDQAKFGNAALHLDGTGDFAKTELSTAFGTGDFTIECFYYNSASFASANRYLFDFGSNGLRIQFFNGTIYYFVDASNSVTTTASGVTHNNWYHIAAVRYNGQMNLYIDGVSRGTKNSVTTNLTERSLTIGDYGGGSQALQGFIDEFRISNFARYTSNFTAPAEPFADKGQ